MTTLTALLLLLPVQDDVEAKKKRLGELLKQMDEINKEAEKILLELSDGDQGRRQAILMEAMRKNAPKLAQDVERSQTASNERMGAVLLKTFASAQADFRANDRDRNTVNDFWAGDLSGLFRVDPGDGPLKLIELSAALADAKPCVALDQPGTFGAMKIVAIGKPAPKAGYWFAYVPKFENDAGAAEKHDDGFGRCAAKFAYCSFPAEYGKTGKPSFLITEQNTVWKKDTGGKPVEIVPADLRAAGWSRLD